jgi:hypothetical protein
LLQAILCSETRVARACHAILLTRANLDVAQLAVLLSRKQRDILIASRTIMLVNQRPVHEQLTLYRQALHSPFAAVRAIAVRALLALEAPHLADALAREVILQPHAQVRHEAISYLRAHGIDPAAHYRTALELGSLTPRQIQACLAALAGMRQAVDIPLFKQFAFSEVAPVRKAALEAWVTLAESDKDMIAMRALEDPDPRVRQFSLHLVTRKGAFISLGQVRGILAGHGDTRLLEAFIECGCLGVQRR